MGLFTEVSSDEVFERNTAVVLWIDETYGQDSDISKEFNRMLMDLLTMRGDYRKLIAHCVSLSRAQEELRDALFQIRDVSEHAL